MTFRNLAGTAGMLAAVMASLAAASTPAPAVLSFGTNGSIRLTSGKTEIAHIVPGLVEAGWTGGSYVGASPKDIRPGLYRGKIKAKSGEVQSELRSSDVPQGVSLAYTLTPKAAMPLHILHVTVEFPEEELAGQACEILVR